MKHATKCAVILHLDNEKNDCIAPLWKNFFEAGSVQKYKYLAWFVFPFGILSHFTFSKVNH